MRIAVVGLGKIGLPLAVQYASRGHTVIGADINTRTIDLVNAGTEPFPGEAQLADLLAAQVAEGRLTATTDTTGAVASSDVVVVVVPLFVNADDAPDFGWLDSATTAIGRGLRPGSLVIFETTLPVGTTRGRWKPLLERVSGLTEGLDFHLAFSPERVLTGRVFVDLQRYPKLVGGLSDEGSKRTIEFYEGVLEFEARPDLPRDNGIWDLGSAEAAELAKLAETTYRDVNIGLANQFAKYAGSKGIDIYQVIAGANSQPYSHIHQPGIAVGGHCIPIYPRLYLWNDPTATIVRAARQVNTTMPAYCVNLARDAFGPLTGARVVVLGISYRGGQKQTAFSGAFPTVEALRDAGAIVTVHDPLYSDHEIRTHGFSPYTPGGAVDIAVLQADHPEYVHLKAADLPGVRVLVDGRNIVNPVNWPGVHVLTLGTTSNSPLSLP